MSHATGIGSNIHFLSRRSPDPTSAREKEAFLYFPWEFEGPGHSYADDTRSNAAFLLGLREAGFTRLRPGLLEKPGW